MLEVPMPFCPHLFLFRSLLFSFVACAVLSHGKNLPLKGEVFEVDGRTAFIIPADADVPGPTPWVWYAPTLPNLPGKAETWMFERFTKAGIAIAGIDVGESYGSPDGRALYSALYEELTLKRGFHDKPMMLGRSRGGLMTLSWAADNPDKVSGFAGVYPVCNIASYPGIARAAGAYNKTAAELERDLAEHNPVDRTSALAALAKAGVPMFAIHGDVDKVVPLELNSGLLKTRYKELGGEMEIIVPAGQGHNMWSGFFECQELVDFVFAQLLPRGPSRLASQLASGEKQTLVVYGTSLTAGGAWVGQAKRAIEAQYPDQLTLVNAASGGKWSTWGVGNLTKRVLEKKPDTLLIEFGINDAFLKYKTPVEQARTNLVAIIDRTQAELPDCEIMLMTMNPPIGVHLERRPNIAAYYQMYRAVARSRGLRLIDHEPNWRSVLETNPKRFDQYVPDGIHPRELGCEKIITPHLLRELGFRKPISDKLVVLTFDDSNKSDRAFVAGELQKHGFGATFYVTEGLGFLKSKTNYTSWTEIRELHELGFEIGNHTLGHLHMPRLTRSNALVQVRGIEARCAEHNIPKPATFCFPGFAHNPRAVDVIDALGYQFARRGVGPEFPDKGRGARGPVYDPEKHHRLLVPTTGYAGPDWGIDDLRWAVSEAQDGKIAVLCFHGVPAKEHAWVSCKPEAFSEYMQFLKDEGCTVIAMRDLADYIDISDND